MAATRPPSGHQHVIVHGSARAEITQAGATLRRYTVGRHDVIDGFGRDERATDGRGQILAPWPNRITDGRYSYRGQTCQAPLNEPDRHDAIHGLARWLDWHEIARSDDSTTLACTIRPQPGYEWQLELQVAYTLGADGLAVTLQARNVDTDTAPFGAGFHPYLRVGADPVDGLDLHLPARAHLDPETATMVPVAGSAWDFTDARRIDSVQLDTAYGELVRGEDGMAQARLSDPGTGRSVELWVDEGYHYLMAYTADQVGRPDRRRRAVAVEPMTCPPEAFRSGVDVIDLDPGATWTGTWGVRFDG